MNVNGIKDADEYGEHTTVEESLGMTDSGTVFGFCDIMISLSHS